MTHWFVIDFLKYSRNTLTWQYRLVVQLNNLR